MTIFIGLVFGVAAVCHAVYINHLTNIIRYNETDIPPLTINAIVSAISESKNLLKASSHKTSRETFKVFADMSAIDSQNKSKYSGQVVDIVWQNEALKKERTWHIWVLGVYLLIPEVVLIFN